MDMVFKTSDMELMAKANKLISYEEYLEFRNKYIVRNPKQFVLPDTHRRIMEGAVRSAKAIIDHGGTDEEIKNACLYLYICTDAKKYHLNWNKARRDLNIPDILKKYLIEIIHV